MRILALVAVMALAAACTEASERGEDLSGSPSVGPWHGGTLRLFTDPVRARAEDWDPSGYFFGPHMELYRCCLTRTLYSYEGLPALEGGSVLLPDLADGFPEV